MNLNIILGQVLKRMKVNNLVYNNKIARECLSLFINNYKIQNVNEAKNFLNNISPKPTGTSYANHKVNDIVYDLKIIVPAYNVERYIDECLSSILAQKTNYKFLVEIINDGSSDNTREILKKYENNPHVNIIDQCNKGFSGARNTGLQEINSKYLMFVDSDDKLENNSIEALLNSAFENDSDIVEGGFYKFNNNNKILDKNLHSNKTNIQAFWNLRGYPWGKVIRSSLFKNIKFPEGFWYEDTIFMYLIYPLCKKASTISDIVYWYRYNINGITVTSRKNEKSIDTYWIMEQMLEDMNLFGIEKSQDIYEFTLYQIYNNFSRTKYMNSEIQKSIFLLSANIIQTKFKNFKSTHSRNSEVENALRNNNYNKYYLSCILF